MLVNSVPLSETQLLGRPRRAIKASSSRATRAPDSEVSGISAGMTHMESIAALLKSDRTTYVD
jgi:hypothetical protein